MFKIIIVIIPLFSFFYENYSKSSCHKTFELQCKWKRKRSYDGKRKTWNWHKIFEALKSFDTFFDESDRFFWCLIFFGILVMYVMYEYEFICMWFSNFYKNKKLIKIIDFWKTWKVVSSNLMYWKINNFIINFNYNLLFSIFFLILNFWCPRIF